MPQELIKFFHWASKKKKMERSALPVTRRALSAILAAPCMIWALWLDFWEWSEKYQAWQWPKAFVAFVEEKNKLRRPECARSRGPILGGHCSLWEWGSQAARPIQLPLPSRQSWAEHKWKLRITRSSDFQRIRKLIFMYYFSWLLNSGPKFFKYHVIRQNMFGN